MRRCADYRKRKRSGKQKPIKFLYLVATVIASSFFTVSFCLQAVSESEHTSEGETSFQAAETTILINMAKAVAETKSFLYVAQIDDTRYLELINSENPIWGEPNNMNLVRAWPSVPVLTTETMIHEAALDALRSLYNAAQRDGAENFYISSGYRDYDAQARLYEEIEDKTLVAPPGYSEHHSGLAVDIMVAQVEQCDMGDSFEGRWLSENAWKHGFILRYTLDKQHITGYSSEPWHFRYIGQPHAYYCWLNDFCLEEYIAFLKETDGYSVEYDGIEYSVLYQSAQDGIIHISQSEEYIVSGDNNGGYIITAWGASHAIHDTNMRR